MTNADRFMQHILDFVEKEGDIQLSISHEDDRVLIITTDVRNKDGQTLKRSQFKCSKKSIFHQAERPVEEFCFHAERSFHRARMLLRGNEK